MQAKTNGVETTSGTKLSYAKCLPNLNTCLPQTSSLITKLLILTGKYKKLADKRIAAHPNFVFL